MSKQAGASEHSGRCSQSPWLCAKNVRAALSSESITAASMPWLSTATKPARLMPSSHCSATFLLSTGSEKRAGRRAVSVRLIRQRAWRDKVSAVCGWRKGKKRFLGPVLKSSGGGQSGPSGVRGGTLTRVQNGGAAIRRWAPARNREAMPVIANKGRCGGEASGSKAQGARKAIRQCDEVQTSKGLLMSSKMTEGGADGAGHSNCRARASPAFLPLSFTVSFSPHQWELCVHMTIAKTPPGERAIERKRETGR